MDRNNFINSVVRETSNLNRWQAAEAISAVERIITSELKNGRSVKLGNFGTFEPKQRAARTGRNPHTGEAVPIPARVIPSFKAGKSLKDAVTKTVNKKKGG